MVARSLRYIASGSSSFSPSLNAVVGAVGDDQHVGLLERRLEVAADQRAHLLRLAVVGVVVAAGQGVGAEDDPALHLVAEAGVAGGAHDVLGARVVDALGQSPAGRSASRRSGRGWTTPRPAGSGSTSPARARSAGRTPRRPRRRPWSSARPTRRSALARRPGSPRRRARLTTPIRTPGQVAVGALRGRPRPAPAAAGRSRWSRAGRARRSPRGAARRRARSG